MSQTPDPSPFADLEPIEIEPVDIAGSPAWLVRLPHERTVIAFGQPVADHDAAPIRDAVFASGDQAAAQRRYGDLRERLLGGLDGDEAWWMDGDDVNVRNGDVELLLHRFAEVLTELGPPGRP